MPISIPSANQLCKQRIVIVMSVQEYKEYLLDNEEMEEMYNGSGGDLSD